MALIWAEDPVTFDKEQGKAKHLTHLIALVPSKSQATSQQQSKPNSQPTKASLATEKDVVEISQPKRRGRKKGKKNTMNAWFYY